MILVGFLQAEEQQHRRHSEAAREEEDKKAEIYNHVTGDFLSEAREQAESVHGRCRPLASRYKGMTTNELKTFRNSQLEQIEQIRVSLPICQLAISSFERFAPPNLAKSDQRRVS